MATWSNESKNTETWSNESKTSQDATWAETAPATWGTVSGTWALHQIWNNESKNTETWTNESKS